ncbi:MAG: hypothetical protein E7591_06235 [Ruminococcaceae bacterium]|nr:hypothetical protein [Oscillospiraceae bacterium]
MKKCLLILLSALLIISLVSCGEKDSQKSDAETPGKVTDTDIVETVLNPMEYTLYQNIFYNDMAADYEGVTVTKEGIFAVIQDKFSDKLRYYVWGYSDNTLCCDWQWEFVPKDISVLPEPGSKIKVTGTLTASDDALDGHWFTEGEVAVMTNYTQNGGNYDLTTMSPTLARVQLVNIMNFPEEVNEEKIAVYGRIMAGNMIQHPYYDNSWSVPLESKDALPAAGTYVTINGVFSGTTTENSKIVVESIDIDE